MLRPLQQAVPTAGRLSHQFGKAYEQGGLAHAPAGQPHQESQPPQSAVISSLRSRVMSQQMGSPPRGSHDCSARLVSCLQRQDTQLLPSSDVAAGMVGQIHMRMGQLHAGSLSMHCTSLSILRSKLHKEVGIRMLQDSWQR